VGVKRNRVWKKRKAKIEIGNWRIVESGPPQKADLTGREAKRTDPSKLMAIKNVRRTGSWE
jgi:hypothetical protein